LDELDTETNPATTGAGGTGASSSGDDVSRAGSGPAASSGGASTEGTPDDVALAEGGSGGQASTPAAPVTFWTEGVTISSADAAEKRFLGVAVDAAENIYAVGYVGASSVENRGMLISKFDRNGVPDPNFTSGDVGAGSVVVNFTAYTGAADDPETLDVNEGDTSVEEATDVVVQSTGQVVVAGRVEDPSVEEPDSTTPVDIVVFRLGADGARDSAFGDGGVTVLNPGGGAADLVYGIAVDDTDRIYVFGHGSANDPERTDQDRYVWRLLPNGTLDAAFGTGGEFSFDIPQGGATLALNDNSRRGSVIPAALGGGVMLSGYTSVAGRNQIVLVKLDESGTPDPTFSGDGVVRLAPFATGMAEAYGAAVQSDGSVVTTGYGNVDLERSGGAELLDMVSFRVNAAGNFDPSYGANGAAVYDPSGGEDRGRAIAALPDDRIMIAGTATVTAGDKNAMLLLLQANGRPAADFATGVHKGYEFGGTNEEFRGVSVAPSGSFVAAAGFSSGRADRDKAVLVVLPVLPIAEASGSAQP
jgi:uncharacterized delta-60 repeat protein